MPVVEYLQYGHSRPQIVASPLLLVQEDILTVPENGTK
jgi:hypothetical protein